MSVFQVFEKHPTTDAYYVNGSYTPWAIVGRDKRFSDAELAAEEWCAYAYHLWGGTRDSQAFRQYVTFHTFAQLPHFDE